MKKSEKLKKELKVLDLFAISSGALFSSGFFLLPGIAFAKTGASVILSYLLASTVMLLVILTKAELATALPRAGGTYYFLDRSIGPLAGTVAGLSIWLVLILKSAFAFVGMGVYISVVLNSPQMVVAILFACAFGILNLIGVKEAGSIQIALVVFIISSLTVFLVSGYLEIASKGTFFFGPFFKNGVFPFLETVGMVMIAFAGLTKIDSVAEEIKNPEKNIPRAMFLSLATATFFYLAGITLMTLLVPPEKLSNSLYPAELATHYIDSKVVTALIIAAAISGFAAAGNAALMAASRFPLAMGRDKILPYYFAKVNRRFGTPVLAVLITVLLVVNAIAFLSVEKIAKMASSLQLFMFCLEFLSLIILREAQLEAYDPGFRTPFYPWPQIIGITAASVLIIVLGPIPMLFTFGIVMFSGLWFWFFASKKIRRKGALYHWFAKLGEQKSNFIEIELRNILREKGPRKEDPFGEIIESAKTLIFHDDVTFEEVVHKAANILSLETDIPSHELYEKFLRGARFGMTPVSGGIALPHARIENISKPYLLIAKVDPGIKVDKLEDDNSLIMDDKPIEALFFLLSPKGEPKQHLRILALIAELVDSEEFLHCWRKANNGYDLKGCLTRKEHLLQIKLDKENPHLEELVGKQIKDLSLPEDCLIFKVKRGGRSFIPRGTFTLLEGDVLFVISTSKQSIEELKKLYLPP